MLLVENMASSSVSGKRRRLVAAEHRPGASVEARCSVCGNCQSLRNSYGVPACESCNKMFKNTVRGMVFTLCDGNGTCPVTATTKFDCYFCWMSKCYESGMTTKHVKMRSDYIRRRGRRMNPTLPPDLQPVLNSKANHFIQCLLLMEQHYYQWLHLSNNYNVLSNTERKILRDRSYIRGTALQLVERSLVAHDVLWLHNCFFDPYSCEIPAIRNAASAILNFVIDCRSANINVEQFIKLKIKLALKNDVSVQGEEAVPNDIFDMISAIEGKMIDGLVGRHFNLTKIENPSLISSSKLFQYNVMNPEIHFPAHTIHIIAEEATPQ